MRKKKKKKSKPGVLSIGVTNLYSQRAVAMQKTECYEVNIQIRSLSRLNASAKSEAAV